MAQEIFSTPTVVSDDRAGTLVSDLDIVIVNYKTAALVKDCLASVFASQMNFSYRVYVVDNGSHDDSLSLLEAAFPSQTYPNLILIASHKNLGFAGGNNIALRQICAAPIGQPDSLYAGCQPESRYILLLNPDTVVTPTALQQLYDFAEAHPAAGVVGPKLVRGNGQLDLACRRSFPSPSVSLWRMTGLSKLFPTNPRFAQYNLTYKDPDQTYEVDSVSGACMLVRAEAITQAGILDEAYFMYGEDLDWAYRIKQHGWQVFYYPVAQVTHFKGESSKQRSTGAIVNFYQAMYIFYQKHYARSTFFLLNWLIIAGIVLKAGLALALNQLKPKAKRRVSK